MIKINKQAVKNLLSFLLSFHKNKNKVKKISVIRSKKARSPLIFFINLIFTLTAFFVLLAAFGLYSVKNLYERPGHNGEAISVLIPAGSGVGAIADLLKNHNLIGNTRIFIYGIYLEDKSKFLKAGEYEIPAYASMQEIADILVNGHALQYSITFPEGMTVAQIFAKLKEEPLLTGDLAEQMPPEGSLMTNTIKFVRGTTRQKIVQRLAKEQEYFVQEIWKNRAADLPLKTAEQMVILASIVEKETGVAAERPRVAAVFYNRLKKNMRLQSDPTILYGLFGGQGKPANRPIYRSDLEKETPYNTYKIMGLPPTPICNPGVASLMAVAHPLQTEDLYFVADGSGGHIFSKTLSEHNSNVSKWRTLRKTQEQTGSENRENSGDNRQIEKTGEDAGKANVIEKRSQRILPIKKK